MDLTNPATPVLTRKVPLFGSVYDLAASGSTVVMALGINGAQHVAL